jgi:AcrR family transcriptional regulator
MDVMSNDHSAPLTRLVTGVPSADTAHLKQERAIRTRTTILNAAAAAFADAGFPHVTIKDIADGAEMTKGAVYFHFANKEALAVAVTEMFYKRLQRVVSPALDEGDPSSPQTIVDFIMRMAHAFRDDTFIKAGARLQIERPYIKADLPVPYVEMTETLVRLMENCHAAGRLPVGCEPAGMARALGSAVFGAQHISWVLADRADVVERIEEVIEAFLPLHPQS